MSTLTLDRAERYLSALRNVPRLGLFGLWQDQGHNTVLQLTVDALRIDLAGKLEAADVVTEPTLYSV